MKTSLAIWILAVLYPTFFLLFFSSVAEACCLLLAIPIELLIAIPSLLIFEIAYKRILTSKNTLRRKWLNLIVSAFIAVSINVILAIWFLGAFSEYYVGYMLSITLAFACATAAMLTLCIPINKSLKENSIPSITF